MFVIWCGIVMLYGIILVEGKISKEMTLISTFVTSVTLNGLNVTMGYCVRFGFQSPKSQSFVFDLPQVQI